MTDPKHMSDGFVVPHWLFDNFASVSPYDFMVLLTLMRFADSSGRSFPSHRLIAERTGISARKVQDSIRALESVGLVETLAESSNELCVSSNDYRLIRQNVAPIPLATAAELKSEKPS